ncbi:hypothetical protein [Janibacter limosus]|uniref:hypothetical protein n=1 Tax=Janibacter limosus TaxID=53458 RepID=UPI000832EA8A|nr:hypothetical protein [Janibacter limosus]
MRTADFWKSTWYDDHNGFACVVGMCAFWIGPLMFGAMSIMVPGTIRQVRRSEPGSLVDVTPTRSLVVPALLMVVGIVICLLSF